MTVFYSGHGVPGLKDKRGYLLSVDGDPNLAEITGDERRTGWTPETLAAYIKDMGRATSE